MHPPEIATLVRAHQGGGDDYDSRIAVAAAWKAADPQLRSVVDRAIDADGLAGRFDPYASESVFQHTDGVGELDRALSSMNAELIPAFGLALVIEVQTFPVFEGHIGLVPWTRTDDGWAVARTASDDGGAQAPEILGDERVPLIRHVLERLGFTDAGDLLWDHETLVNVFGGHSGRDDLRWIFVAAEGS